MLLNKKFNITFLNHKWEVVKINVKTNVIPRIHEIVYLDGEKTYYRVVNVVHNVVNKKNKPFIIIEKYVDDDIFLKKT